MERIRICDGFGLGEVLGSDDYEATCRGAVRIRYRARRKHDPRRGGLADLTILAGTPSLAPVERGDVRRLGWVGDETPWQIGAIFVSTKIDNQRQDMIVRFLRAFRKGAQEYHDAFGAADDTRRDGPEVAEILAIMEKYMGQPAALLHKAVAYIDPQGRHDLVDVQRQIDWYVAQNLLKGAPKIEDMIDKRTVIPCRQNKFASIRP